MIRASVIVASLLFSPPLAAPLGAASVVIQPASIVQVMCFSKNGDIYAGTAVRVGPDFGVSVNHVTSAPGQCYIGAKPLNRAYKSPTADFSEVLLDDGPYLDIDCGGFIKGRKYLAIGFARAVTPATVLEETDTGQIDHGMAVLQGMVPFIPGMSGGAVISEDTGKLVGVVDATNFEEGLSWAVPLSGTPVCRKNVA